MSTPKIEGAHGPPRYAISLASELQQVIYGIGKISILKKIQARYAYKYACRVIGQVNIEEGNVEVKK